VTRKKDVVWFALNDLRPPQLRRDSEEFRGDRGKWGVMPVSIKLAGAGGRISDQSPGIEP
jgi:hypothetical protein